MYSRNIGRWVIIARRIAVESKSKHCCNQRFIYLHTTDRMSSSAEAASSKKTVTMPTASDGGISEDGIGVLHLSTCCDRRSPNNSSHAVGLRCCSVPDGVAVVRLSVRFSEEFSLIFTSATRRLLLCTRHFPPTHK